MFNIECWLTQFFLICNLTPIRVFKLRTELLSLKSTLKWHRRLQYTNSNISVFKIDLWDDFLFLLQGCNLSCMVNLFAVLRAHYQSSHQQCAREVKSLGTAYAVLNYTFVAMFSAVVCRTLTAVSATSVDTSGAILAGSAQLTNIYIRVINKRNNKMASKTKTDSIPYLS